MWLQQECALWCMCPADPPQRRAPTNQPLWLLPCYDTDSVGSHAHSLTHLTQTRSLSHYHFYFNTTSLFILLFNLKKFTLTIIIWPLFTLQASLLKTSMLFTWSVKGLQDLPPFFLFNFYSLI